jgi:hypothetical protein
VIALMVTAVAGEIPPPAPPPPAPPPPARPPPPSSLPIAGPRDAPIDRPALAEHRPALLDRATAWPRAATGRVLVRSYAGLPLWGGGVGAAIGPVTVGVHAAATSLVHRLGDATPWLAGLDVGVTLACSHGRPTTCVGARGELSRQAVATAATPSWPRRSARLRARRRRAVSPRCRSPASDHRDRRGRRRLGLVARASSSRSRARRLDDGPRSRSADEPPALAALASLALAACVTEDADVLQEGTPLLSCADVPGRISDRQACLFTDACVVPTPTDPTCCQTIATCVAGTLDLASYCQPGCAACMDDTGCVAGRQVCDGNVCVACPDTTNCAPCGPGLVPLVRNGCPTCTCAPASQCDLADPTACNGDECYPGLVCAPGCLPGDPTCCANVCAAPGCPSPAPLGCDTDCATNPMCTSCVTGAPSAARSRSSAPVPAADNAAGPAPDCS